MERKGLFIVFDGPDRVGKSSQVSYLTKYIKSLDKYQDVLETHEPWKSSQIKRKLEEDKDAYSSGEEMAELYIEDRARHSRELIRPNLKAGVIVISDRYKMSTCAYQWAQGVSLTELLGKHDDRGILTPDLTFCFDAPIQEIIKRGTHRNNLAGAQGVHTSVEKFERDNVFAEKVLEAYRALNHMAQLDSSIFGKVVRIDANKSVEEVSKDILASFEKLYSDWKKGEYKFVD